MPTVDAGGDARPPPDVSVVIPVRNAAADLDRTLETMLSQDGVAFEIVLVDDGSDDGTAEVARRIAAGDGRLVVLSQAAAGITQALRAGCARARGVFVARQDAGGTRALPGRLALPAAVLRAQADVELVSCGVRWLTPDGTHLEDAVQAPEEADPGLRSLDIRTVRGPTHHAATMFRRATYEAVGGYRSAFRFAQDLDLWLRLAEHGRHVALDDVLTERRLTATGISATWTRWQRAFAAVAVEAARLRREGRPDDPAVARAEALSRRLPATPGRRARARGLYHVACRVRPVDSALASRLLGQAVATDPLCWRAWARRLAWRSR
jgi:glycosyltransferase involved in cell wall biosynthesis